MREAISSKLLDGSLQRVHHVPKRGFPRRDLGSRTAPALVSPSNRYLEGAYFLLIGWPSALVTSRCRSCRENRMRIKVDAAASQCGLCCTKPSPLSRRTTRLASFLIGLTSLMRVPIEARPGMRAGRD